LSTRSSGGAKSPATGFHRLLTVVGPGIITGASDDDPSGVSTYSVAGAAFGLNMLWLALLTTPMMAVVQGMCGRIGLVTGVGLAQNMKRHLSRWLLLPLLFAVIAANTINAGADLEGMAASAHLVVGLPVVAYVISFAVLLIVLQLAFSYRSIANVLKYLTFALLAYVITAFVARPDWTTVLLHLVVPHLELTAAFLTTLMAVLGTTITPYLFFWESSLTVEEDVDAGKTSERSRRGATKRQIADLHLDANAGMVFSNVVMVFIIVTTASTLGAHGIHHIGTAEDAARALTPLAGRFASLVFACGMVGTGLLAIPALVGSSAFVFGEVFDLRVGLNRRVSQAPIFYAVLAVGTAIGALMGVLHVDPIGALFWAAVINGIVSVPLIAVVVLLSSRKDVMGTWVSSPVARAWGWATFASMTAAAIGIFAFWGKS